MQLYRLQLFVNIAFLLLVGTISSASARNPFACTHQHGSFQEPEPISVGPRAQQVSSDWRVIDQHGSKIIMQHADGRIREISIAQNR